MSRGWKALASAAVAAALVVAPLTIGGAVADDAHPIDVVASQSGADVAVSEAAVEVDAPLAEDESSAESISAPAEQTVPAERAAPAEHESLVEQAAPAPSEEAPAHGARPGSNPSESDKPANEGVCEGTHVHPAGSTKTAEYTAPEGFLVSAVCVKAGSIKQGDGPEITPFDPPQATVTLTHSSGKDISHYTVTLVPVPAVETVATPVLTFIPPTCDASGSFDAPGVFPHMSVTVTPAYHGPGEYRMEAATDPGYVFPDGTEEMTHDFVVEGALGIQSHDPHAACFLPATPDPDAPAGSPSTPGPEASASTPSTPDPAAQASTPYTPPAPATAASNIGSHSAAYDASLAQTGGVDVRLWVIGAAALMMAGAWLVGARLMAARRGIRS